MCERDKLVAGVLRPCSLQFMRSATPVRRQATQPLQKRLRSAIDARGWWAELQTAMNSSRDCKPLRRAWVGCKRGQWILSASLVATLRNLGKMFWERWGSLDGLFTQPWMAPAVPRPGCIIRCANPASPGFRAHGRLLEPTLVNVWYRTVLRIMPP